MREREREREKQRKRVREGEREREIHYIVEIKSLKAVYQLMSSPLTTTVLP